MILLSILSNIDIPSSPWSKVDTGFIIFQKVWGAHVSLWTYIWHAKLMLGNHGTYPHVSRHVFASEFLCRKVTLIQVILGGRRRTIANKFSFELSHEHFLINLSKLGWSKSGFLSMEGIPKINLTGVKAWPGQQLSIQGISTLIINSLWAHYWLFNQKRAALGARDCAHFVGSH